LQKQANWGNWRWWWSNKQFISHKESKI